jgi:hypothetical protein
MSSKLDDADDEVGGVWKEVVKTHATFPNMNLNTHEENI